MEMNINKLSVDFDKLGFGENMAEVHKNDYIRISALNHYGGLWSDTDIIYFRPMVNIPVNIPENKDKEIKLHKEKISKQKTKMIVGSSIGGALIIALILSIVN
jgi:hypothetical protein